MGVEILQNRLKGEVVLPNGEVLFGAEAKSVDDLDRKLGDELSEYTLEQGMRLPEGTQINQSRIKKVGPFVIKSTTLSSKVLIP